MRLKKVARIIVPIVMIAIIAIIWIVQNTGAAHDATTDLEYPLHVTSVNIEELTAHNMPMIIDFGATECEPCKAMAPVLQEVNKDMQGKAIIQFVDVWENPDAANGFPVQIIPTQLFVKADGTPYVPSTSIDIDFLLYADNATGEHVFTIHQGGLTSDQMMMILEDMGV